MMGSTEEKGNTLMFFTALSTGAFDKESTRASFSNHRELPFMMAAWEIAQGLRDFWESEQPHEQLQHVLN